MTNRMQNAKSTDDKINGDVSTTTAEPTSQYQIRPSLSKSFQMANVKEIIGEVFQQILDGTLSVFFLILQFSVNFL